MTDQREPVAAVKARSDEAQSDPAKWAAILFRAHPQLCASVVRACFLGNTPLCAMQRTTST